MKCLSLFLVSLLPAALAAPTAPTDADLLALSKKQSAMAGKFTLPELPYEQDVCP